MPEVTTAQEYFAFGFAIPYRNYTLNQPYRYGFNGKENDNQVKLDWSGNGIPGAQQDYGERIYDPRVGRFFSMDPIASSYPMLTPFQFASNRPIDGIDMDGLEFFKRDNTNYHWDYLPVLKAPTILTAANNVANNTLALFWNGTLGGALQLSQSTTNYLLVDGWKPNSSNPINHTIDDVFDGLNKTSNYISETPIKRQVKDLGASFTDWNNYEIVPQLFIFHELSTPIENPKVPFVDFSVTDAVKVRPAGISDMEWGNALHYDRLAGGTGAGLPTQLALKYPKTDFLFTPRGAAGADVQFVGGEAPWNYPGSTWKRDNKFGDFKTIKDTKFTREINSGKLPKNTQKLTYDPKTGKLL